MSYELPIVSSDGELRERLGIWTWCYICFPNSEQDAIRAATCLVDENDAMEAGLQAGYGEVGAAVQKLLTKRMTRARIAGNVFFQMLLNKQTRGEPDFRKAVFAVSEWASVTKTVKGRSLPSDLDNLRKTFKEFRNSLYFWAAFDLQDEADQLDIFGGSGDLDPLLKFLMTASEIQRKSEQIQLWQDNEPLRDWEPLVVPERLQRELSEIATIQLPTEPEEVRERLKGYRNKPNEFR